MAYRTVAKNRKLLWAALALIVLVAIIGSVFIIQNRQAQSTEKKRAALIETLGAGSRTSDFSTSDAFYDGGPTVSVKSVYLDTPETVKASATERLAALGYTLECPGKAVRTGLSDDGRDITVRSENKCALSGHGVKGDVWFYDYASTYLDALFWF